MADAWLNIGSAKLNSFCGEETNFLLEDALDGTGQWYHSIYETHWFVIDLGETYTIKKVRGRSFAGYDPTDVNIYIDDNNPPTTLCEEGISTWQDTVNWVEITLTTEGTGRYIMVEIEATECGSPCWIRWGYTGWFTIFDAYGAIYVPPHALRPTVAVGNPLIF